MTLFFSCTKRYSRLHRSRLLPIHAFGNLTTILLIVMHFAQQISRPAQFYLDLGTGLIPLLYELLIVPAGFFLTLGLLRNRLRHGELPVSVSVLVTPFSSFHALVHFDSL